MRPQCRPHQLYKHLKQLYFYCYILPLCFLHTNPCDKPYPIDIAAQQDYSQIEDNGIFLSSHNSYWHIANLESLKQQRTDAVTVFTRVQIVLRLSVLSSVCAEQLYRCDKAFPICRAQRRWSKSLRRLSWIHSFLFLFSCSSSMTSPACKLTAEWLTSIGRVLFYAYESPLKPMSRKRGNKIPTKWPKPSKGNGKTCQYEDSYQYFKSVMPNTK